MKIFCRNCGNQKHFTLRREVEIEFDYKKGFWNENVQAKYDGIIVCKECGADSEMGDIDCKL